MSIRAGRLEDLELLVAGNAAMAKETEGIELDLPVLREGVRAVLEERVPGRYYLLEVEGRAVAQLLITFEWSDWRNRQVWWIQSVYVAPADRRRGYFEGLYRGVEAEAKAAGAAGLRLYVDHRNRAAQAVYTSLGMNGGHYQLFEAMFGAY
jgi:ribosomal protein S18 acetylase RimI-like enzyme